MSSFLHGPHFRLFLIPRAIVDPRAGFDNAGKQFTVEGGNFFTLPL